MGRPDDHMEPIRAFVGHSYRKEDATVVTSVLACLRRVVELHPSFSWETGRPQNIPKPSSSMRRCFGSSTERTSSSLASRILVDRSWNREIWIVAGNLMSRDAVEEAIGSSDSNRTKQFLMYVESLITGCGRINSMLKIYCS